MEKKTLGLILALIPLIAVIAALVIAFAMTGDVQSMVLEQLPDEVITSYISGFSSGAGGDMFSVSGFSISEDGSSLILTIVVTNPIDYPLIIKQMSYNTQWGGETVKIDLDEQVEIPPESSVEIVLTGDLPGTNLLSFGLTGMPQSPGTSEINTEISFAGIILKNNDGAQGVQQ